MNERQELNDGSRVSNFACSCLGGLVVELGPEFAEKEGVHRTLVSAVSDSFLGILNVFLKWLLKIERQREYTRGEFDKRDHFLPLKKWSIFPRSCIYAYLCLPRIVVEDPKTSSGD